MSACVCEHFGTIALDQRDVDYTTLGIVVGTFDLLHLTGRVCVPIMMNFALLYVSDARTRILLPLYY